MPKPSLTTAAALAALLALSACDGYPRDADDMTTQAAGQAMRVGASHDPPWLLVQADGSVSGPEAAVVQRFAKAHGYRLTWLPGSHDALMGDLERFIHDDPPFAADPLVKMALVHHQFESIHPFYDGNGRTGRIVNVLYLVKEGLLDIPVLYLSRHIVRTKPDYYRLLQAVRDDDAWEDWVLYMLDAVASTAAETIATVQAIKQLLQDTKQRIRDNYRFYSQDLLNNLFNHPYTRVEFAQRELGVSRLTATRYLDALAADGLLDKIKVGRNNYYVNRPLFDLLRRGDAAQP